MTPNQLTDGPMDLSMKTRRKLRLEEFLRQNLDQAPAGRVIQWVDREDGVFRILWTHQSSGAFTQEDAALFRYWALARGKPANLSSVELKQSLRMALNKSPSVERLSATHDEYRYFRFTEWKSRRSATVRSRSPKTLENVRKKSPSSVSLPALIPFARSDGEYPSRPRWTTDHHHHHQDPLLAKTTTTEGFRVPAGDEPSLFPCELSLTYPTTQPYGVWGRGEQHLGRGELMENPLAEQMMDQYLMEKQERGQVSGECLLTTQLTREHLSRETLLRGRPLVETQLRGELARDTSLGDQPMMVLQDPVEKEQLSGDLLQREYSLLDPVVGEHLTYINTHSPQGYLEAKETHHSVPSFIESHSRTDSENHLSFYSEGSGFPKLLMNYDHRSVSTSSPHFSPFYESPHTIPSSYHIR